MSKKAKQEHNYSPRIANKKARFEYEILETFEAGIELQGTEVKSLRLGQASLTEAFAQFRNSELFLIGSHINTYEQGNRANHDPIRQRKLLLHRRELNKLQAAIRQKGLTIVPLALYFNARGIAKVQIGLAKGKARFDKRESIKKRDSQRDVDRQMRQYR